MKAISSTQEVLEKQVHLLYNQACLRMHSLRATKELVEISSAMAEVTRAITYLQEQASLSKLKQEAEMEIKEPLPPLPKQENDKKALPNEPTQEGKDRRELTAEEVKEQLLGALYRITAQLLKEEPVPANLDKIEQIRRNTDTIIRLMDYMT